MTDFTHIEQGSTGLAVKDIQERLESLGFDLGDEGEQALFGRLTATAVLAFRVKNGLPEGEDVDRDTWTALVDATFAFGNRLLYLRMPHFHGRDVFTLQTALASLGFSCTADSIFGAHTEKAVREFQQNAGISSDGIVGHSTFSAINRLHHAWEGKDLLCPETGSLGFARAAEVLERTSICLYGTDDVAQRIAERISNLAMATTATSRMVCAQSLEQAPDDSTLMIQLTSVDFEADDQGENKQDTVPLVIYDNDSTINARMATALGLATTEQPRIVVYLGFKPQSGDSFAHRGEQHAAIALLDALCLSFTV
jgi:predicted transcriptional regulator